MVSVLAVVLGATACSSSGECDELLIYNAQHESLTKEWIDAFTKETGIKVTYRQGGDTELGNQLVAEGDASPADVFLTENSPAMAAVERAGLFADLDPETINQVPSQYRPASGKWTGVAARTTVFVYNKAELQPDQLPKSLLDLQQPAWKGRWGAPPTKADFQAIVAALLQLKGEAATAQWLAGMKANAVDLQRQHRHAEGGQRRRGRRRRDLPLLLVPRSGENQRDERQYGAALLPQRGSRRVRQPLRRRRAQVQQEAGQAQQFLLFITGKAGQEVLEKGTSFEYPVASDVPANPALPPLDTLQAPKVDPSTLDAQKVTDLMTKAGLL